MNDDLISRQAAIDALAKLVPYAICDQSTEAYTDGLTDAYNLIYQLPPVQPEIIRCKDCTHYDGGLCRRWKYSHGTAEDSFCSEAEMSETRLHITELEGKPE